MKGTLRIASLAVAIAIAGCGGGGSSGGGNAPSPAARSAVDGAVTKGPVAGATLFLYRMDASGQKDGEPVAGPITTGADGSWSAQVPDSVPRPLLIESSGGSYTDEATGNTVSAGALNSFLPEGASSAAVTPLSELLVRATREHLAGNPESDLGAGLQAGRDVLDDVLGASFDPLTTVPSATADDPSARQYAAVLGGLSTQANTLSPGTDPFETVIALVEDASDGVIDGQKNGGTVTIGTEGGALPATDGEDLVSAIQQYTTTTDDGDFSDVTSFTVTASSAGNGGVSPQSVSLLGGGSVAFQLTADTGYTLDAVTGCPGTLSGNTFTTDALNAACSLTASFAINEYPVTVDTVAGGSLLPASAQVAHGEVAQFEVTVDEGYQLDGVSGCDGTLSGTTYTTGPVTAACSIVPDFSLKQYAVSTAVVAGDGSFDPQALTVAHGNSGLLTVTPALGYVIDTVAGDNCEVAAGESGYTVGPVTSDCLVEASFTLQQFTVTASATGDGTVSPPVSTVDYGNSAVLSVTPAANQQVASATGCGGVLEGSTYTTGPVMADCAVSVVFEPVTYTVTTIADHGSFTPANPDVAHGDSQMFTVTPDAGYELVSIAGCGGVQDGNGFTTGPVTAACQVTASFAIKTYTITATVSGGNGMIGPNLVENVEHGTTEAFTVTPDQGFVVNTITGCDGSLDGGTYTTGPMVADCDISVSFVEDGTGPAAAVWDQFNWDQANWQ